jgi:TRAP-type C4-dicarboxylate transport system substrate-binding protein
MDGALGDYLKERIEDSVNYRVLGFFENGFRHISNSLRPVRSPTDLVGMKTRVLPSKIQARAFELLGAKALPIDLVDALEGIAAGTIDAQENPLANTVAYGVSNYHRFHTLTGHFYVSRGLFANRAAFEALPESVQGSFRLAVEKATLYQRDLAVREEEIARQAIIDAGGEIIELTPDERAAFVDAVQPLHEEAHGLFAAELFEYLAEA